MASVAIPPLTVPGGMHVFGPVATPGFQHVEFTLDIAAIMSADVLVEWSADGVTDWNHVMNETGLTIGLDKQGLPITTEHFVGNWSAPWPAGFVRLSLNNAVAFLSGGGSLTVS